MTQQTTRDLLMIEPAEFYFNPQTQETNIYQHDDHESHAVVQERALREFRDFRDCLVENGVRVTTFKGVPECPDHIFPNWASTHPDGTLNLYPMLNENRRAERLPHMVDYLKKRYSLANDFRALEHEGLYMESSASVAMDHVNKLGYAAISKRTHPDMIKKWATATGYETLLFPTKTFTDDMPIYHTDLIVVIGETFAIVCDECITDETLRAQVISSLREHREVMHLKHEQVQHYCGNSLAVRGNNDDPYLIMSQHGQEHLTKEQEVFLARHVTDIIGTDIPTIERYGGGSARCQIMELF